MNDGDADIQEIMESGDQLPDSLQNDDLTQDSLFSPVYDGEKIIDDME